MYKNKFAGIHLELLKLAPGKKTTLAKAFSDGSMDLAFTSNEVKSGGMFMVIPVYIAISMLSNRLV